MIFSFSFQFVGPLSFGFLFVPVSVLSLLYLYFYLPETKGRETHQIVALLRSGRRRMGSGKQQILDGGTCEAGGADRTDQKEVIGGRVGWVC